MASHEQTSGASSGWLPDLLFTQGKFVAGTALFCDDQGKIVRLSREANDLANARRLPSRAILPGLVNTHSHTFQRVIRGRTEHRSKADRDTFWTWREKMYQAAARLSPEDIYQGARMAFVEMALTGITTVGEFHYLHHQADGTPYTDPLLTNKLVIQAAREVGLRIALLRTAYVRSGFQQPPDPGQTRFITHDPEEFAAGCEELDRWAAEKYPAGTVQVGVAPHSIRACQLDYFRQVDAYARRKKCPVHVHVSEQPAENEQCQAEHGATPIALFAREGFLSDRFTAIHAIHITGEEVRLLAKHRARVCACPTSERDLGDGAVPARQLLRAGVPVGLGSDSQVQIDLLEDARLLEYHLRMQSLERLILAPDPEGPGTLANRLFAAATRSGAESLEIGDAELREGSFADFFTVDLQDPSVADPDPETLLTNIVFSAERTAIREVYVGGKQIVAHGRHHAQEETVRDFVQVQQRIW
jgi:formimidoylglutamate deiminase